MNRRMVLKECWDIFSLKAVTLFLFVWIFIGLTAISESETHRLSEILLLAFGGVKPDGQIHVMGLFRWLGSLVPYLTISLSGFNRRMLNIVYTLPRVGSANVWWRQKLVGICVGSLFYFCIGLFIVGGLSLFSGGAWDKFPIRIFLYPFLLITCVMVLCLAALFFSQTMIVAIFVIVWGVTSVIGDKANRFIPLLFGCYGMATQVTETMDIILVAIVNIAVIVIIWIIGGKLLWVSFDYKNWNC